MAVSIIGPLGHKIVVTLGRYGRKPYSLGLCSIALQVIRARGSDWRSQSLRGLLRAVAFDQRWASACL